MPFDLIPPAEYENLQQFIAYLRSSKLWPSDFKWNYEKCSQCALGLAFRLWNEEFDAPTHLGLFASEKFISSAGLGIKLKIDAITADIIFCQLAFVLNKNMHFVTPEDVADALEEVLAMALKP